MQAAEKLKPIGPYLIGQVVEYIGRPASALRRYHLSARRFHVVQTEPQQERRVEDSLEEMGFGSFVPRVPKKVRIIRERYRTVMRPMLVGYVLAGFAPDEEWQQITYMRGVLRLFMIDDRPIPVGEFEMQCLREAEQRECAGTERTRKALWLKVDDFVQVKEGPFSSFFGLVVEVDQKRGVAKVEIDIFGRPTPVELEGDQVEVILDKPSGLRATQRPQYRRPRSPR